MRRLTALLGVAARLHGVLEQVALHLRLEPVAHRLRRRLVGLLDRLLKLCEHILSQLDALDLHAHLLGLRLQLLHRERREARRRRAARRRGGGGHGWVRAGERGWLSAA